MSICTHKYMNDFIIINVIDTHIFMSVYTHKYMSDFYDHKCYGHTHTY